MASHGISESINAEKTVDSELGSFQPVAEQQFGSDVSHEEDREPGSNFNLSGETENEKDNNESPGMSFQILSNFLVFIFASIICEIGELRI